MSVESDVCVHWWVMTHLKMPQFKDWLVAENVKRLGNGKAVLEPFYPSDFLDGKDSLTPNPSPKGEGRVGEGRGTSSKFQVSSSKFRGESGGVERDLSRYVFIKCSRTAIAELVDANRKLGHRYRLMHYKDTDGADAVVPGGMMDRFFDACLKYRGFFEIVPLLHGIEAMDKVLIKTGPFAGMQASVVHVSHSHGEVHLELELELVGGVMNIKMSDVKRSDVSILNRSAVDAIRADFIEYAQKHLLEVMEHRVKGVNDDDVRRRDMAMLMRLFRYRNHNVENKAAQAHFMALMLICAHLCRYSDEEKELTDVVLARLAEINMRPASKVATDTRAYLWIALYIVTRNPEYRDAAKHYVREFQPKSERLRRFVTLIRTGKKL